MVNEILNVIESPLLLIVAVDGVSVAPKIGEGLTGPGPNVCPMIPEKSNRLWMKTNGECVSPRGTTVPDEKTLPIAISCDTGDEIFMSSCESAADIAFTPDGEMKRPTSPLDLGPMTALGMMDITSGSQRGKRHIVLECLVAKHYRRHRIAKSDWY